MHNFLQRHGKLLSVGLSVVCSVLLVAVVVSAATTIGTAITTAGNITTSAGNIDATAGNLTVGGTANVTGLTTLGSVTSTVLSAWNGIQVGRTATTTINSSGNLAVAGTASVTGQTTLGNASSTMFTAHQGLSVGNTATTTIFGASTSTFASSVYINESSVTSSLQVGHVVSGAAVLQGTGGCIALASTSGTVSGLNFLYLIVRPNESGDSLYLATSTDSQSCGN